MRYLKYAALLGILLFAAAGSVRAAQVRVGVGIGPVYVGPEPVCAYGYYPYYPYSCAPYGYWGPDYFYDGVFVGFGPWFGWGFGPTFRGRFRDFDDFRRFGGFRGDRFRDFRDRGGLRDFR